MDVPGYGSSIPAGRMKGNRPHRVPLSDAAMAILERRRGQHDGLVFGNRAGRVPSQNAVAKLAKPHTTHGFRSTFRDWVNDTGRNGEAAEHALAHAVGNSVERCYARSDMLERRRPRWPTGRGSWPRKGAGGRR